MNTFSAYWKWDSALPSQLIDHLVNEEISNSTFVDGLLSAGSNLLIRRNKVAWFPGQHWLAGVLYNYALHANQATGWAYNIALPEAAQIAKYSEGEFYNRHADAHPLSAEPFTRKITVVCQLSDNTEFTGGELFLDTVSLPISMARGTVVAFPSALDHWVTPVTSGTRMSATTWALGSNIK